MAYEDLIHQIYNAIEEPHTWQEVLANIAKELDSSLIFLAARTGVDQQPFAFIQSGFADGHFEGYQEYFYQIDQWTHALLNYAPNQFHSSHYVVDDRKFLKSEIYNDFARPAGIRHGMGCLMLGEDDGIMAEVGIMRGLDTDYYDERTRVIASHLIKHVHRSLAISKKMQALGTHHSNFQQLLECNTDALFICNDVGQLLEFNSAAQELLVSGRLLKTGALKRLYFVDKVAQRQMEELKMQMKQIVSATCNYAFNVQTETTRYRVKMQPWMYSQVHALGVSKVPALMLTIRPLSSELKQGASDLIAAYHFTRAEADVALLLCQGIALAGIAELRDSSLATVRQQVKMCMSKASVHSQAELVAKLLAYAVE